MIYSEFLDVSVLFFFTSMNETNFSLVLVYVVFLGMVLVKKDIGVTTPLANVFVFLGSGVAVNDDADLLPSSGRRSCAIGVVDERRGGGGGAIYRRAAKEMD